MFGFGKKKKKENLDQAFNRTLEEIRTLDDWDDPKKLERYILDSCEQIVSNTKEIEAEKKEYRIVTKYLNDIDILENMPEEERADLKVLAGKIVELSRSRSSFEHREKRISEENYTMMEENFEDVPNTILRLKENEIYQHSLEKDMHHLEGEKNAIEIERENIKRAEKNSRIVSILLFFICLLALAIILFFDNTSDKDITWYFVALLVFGGVSFSLFFAWSSSIRRRRKRSLKYLNKIIPMLNSSRMKYANITNAVRYVYNRYSVESAMELEYIFNNYQIEKAERDLYRRNNRDMEFCVEQFMEFLESKKLYDSKIWEYQARALVNHDEMVEVKHRLIVRRQKIRDQINHNTESVKLERDEIDRVMQEHNFFVPEILEIIHSVDKLCGLNQYKRA
ncbi:MAG: hypothetical protein K5851_04610 [Lachnospiraceae bacterium]|nr:hypothetical protein [Lachnospiraceae bacterium]